MGGMPATKLPLMYRMNPPEPANCGPLVMPVTGGAEGGLPIREELSEVIVCGHRLAPSTIANRHNRAAAMCPILRVRATRMAAPPRFPNYRTKPFGNEKG